jgi:hypothetical protein
MKSPLLNPALDVRNYEQLEGRAFKTAGWSESEIPYSPQWAAKDPTVGYTKGETWGSRLPLRCESL